MKGNEMNRRRIVAAIAILFGLVLLTAQPGLAKPRALKKLRCPKSSGTLQIIPRPVSDITLQSGQKIDFDARLVCKGRKAVTLRRDELSRYLLGAWGAVCEDPLGNRALATFSANKQTVSTQQFLSPGQWACRVVPNGKAACAANRQLSDSLSICGSLRKKLRSLKMRKVDSKWIAFLVADPNDPTAGIPRFQGPELCSDICRSLVPSSARASLLIGTSLRVNQCDRASLGYTLIGAKRRSGDEARICFDHEMVKDSYSINTTQEPGGITLTYPGVWSFYALIQTDAGPVCTPPATITVEDLGRASCSS